MDDPHQPAQIPAPQSAMLFGGVLLAGLAMLTIFARLDQPRVAQLERFEENTAVGDTRYFVLPADPPHPPPAAVILDGRALYPVNHKIVVLVDVHLWRAGRDEATGLAIYRERERDRKKKKSGSAPEPDVYYLKLGPGNYLEVRPAPPRKQASYLGSKKRCPGVTVRAEPAEFLSRISV